MMDDTTNPSVESELTLGDLDTANPSSTPAEPVNPSVAGASMDSVSVSAGGNVSDVDNRNSEVSSVVNRLKTDKKKVQKKKKKDLKLKSTVYDSMISEFDEFAANGVANEDRLLPEMSPAHGFEVGDMVWGKVKSHPWWPGHIFSEKFATPSVRRLKRDGLLLVAFFGDSSYGWFHPSELIPFDANYAEKSKQTNSKTFVKAVEEAMDEVSRRSALGLSCMCRSKQNFRETDVQGYYAVDVADYEPGAVYSIDAIGKARESFQPSLAVDFVRRLALEPMGGVNGDIDFVKNKAKVVSYRRAVYEEFDETYAQAFGYDSARPSSGSVQEQDHRKTPSKAPLSGRQVFADTSGKGKSSAKPNKPKDQSKKDKYLFKRRDEPKEVKPHPKKVQKKVTPSSQLEHIEDGVAVPAGDYVLQKRPSTTHDESISKDSDANMEDTTVIVESEDTGLKTSNNDGKTIDLQMEDKTTGSDLVVDRSATDKRAENADNGPKKVKKIAKRPVEAGSSEKKKKKIKKEQLISDGTNKAPLVGPGPQGPDDNKPITSHTSNNEPELPLVLSDLLLLALDPFHTMNRGRLVKTRQVFIKFRSLVFQKSLTLSQTPDDDDSNGNDNRSNKPSENATGVTPVKSQPVSTVRSDDPTLGGRKRGPSDRQEEMAARKKKKVGEIRTLTKDKKVVKKIDEPTVKQPVVKTLKKPGPEMLKRTEQRAPLEPTSLMIKFPPGGSLPSTNELKARFARFGPMDHSGTRIYWNTFACRVVYRHKAHALAAYKFVVGSSSLFGNTGVKCSLKEVGSDAEPVKAVKDEHPEERAPASMVGAASNVQLKSILKKSGGEEAAGSGGRGRVKFMLSGEENEMKNKNGASSLSSKSSSSHSTMDVNSKNFQKAVLQSSNPLPPLLPLPNTSPIIISSTTQSIRPPLPPPPQQPKHYATLPLAPPPRLPPPPSLSYGDGEIMATKTPPPPPPVVVPKVDISHQMLSLLTKCNEVVANVTNMFGYVPYRPL